MTTTSDRLDIAELFTRLAHLLDDKRWDDIGTVYADDVVSRSPRGGEIRGRDRIAAYLRDSEVEGEDTQHMTTDVLVDLDGDRATATAHSLVRFFKDGNPPHSSSGLRHKATAVRTPSGWRFAEMEISLLWTRPS